MADKIFKYRIDLSCLCFKQRKRIWHSFGLCEIEATEAAVKAFRDKWNRQLMDTNTPPYHPHGLYNDAVLVEQATQKILVHYTAPTFEIIV